MGGRVVQKYVEACLLLPRTSRKPWLSNDSACLDGSIRRTRRSKRRRGSICGGRTRRRDEEEGAGARSPDACEAGEACWDQLNAIEKEPMIPNEENGSPSGQPEDDTHSYAGDTKHVDIEPGGVSAGERKFDIRTWVLVTAWDPLEAFVFDESYLRVCPHDFTLDESKLTEPRVHLTNLSVRRLHERKPKVWDGQFQRQDKGQQRRRPSSAAASRAENSCKDGVREPKDTKTSEGETEGFIASQAELFRLLGEMDEAGGSGGTKGRGGEEVLARGERLWRTKVSPSIEGVVRKTLVAARPHMRPRTPSFQLYGFDLLLDRQLRPCESGVFRVFSASLRKQHSISRVADTGAFGYALVCCRSCGTFLSCLAASYAEPCSRNFRRSVGQGSSRSTFRRR